MRKALGLSLLLAVGVVYAQSDTSAPDNKIVSGNEARHARHSDARHCLDLKSDAQIIRCAERYRWRR
jgi:hypothetical protein